mgnify:CR=1 FL=1
MDGGEPTREIVQFMFPREDVVFIARMEYPFGETRSVDADWQAMSEGQRLDECFPAYHGIGSYDLLDELGLATEYLPARPELSYPALIMDRHALLWPV